MDETTGTCLNGPDCKAHDGRTAYPTNRPLCDTCLDHARPEIGGLLYDYLDLAQLHEPAMSQAITEKASGSKEKQLVISGHVEALQAEIAHAVSLWEHALRAVQRLHNPGTFAPLWRNTVYDRINLTTGSTILKHARAGHIVQRAVAVIEPRLERLATLPETVVCPTGIEDEPVSMTGWEAVHQLQNLHRRARSFLGRTRRTLSLYGSCPDCGAEALYRQEPQRFKDEPPVWCDACKAQRPYADYERYLTELVWPALAAA